MKKIGEGYYYNVYDLGNGRVLKKQKGKLRFIWYILLRNGLRMSTYLEYKNAWLNIPEIQSIYKRIDNQITDKATLGNPVFLEGINYEQDKVTVFKELLSEHTEEQLKKFLDAYITLIKKFWSYGVDERVYNFTINTGINSRGEMVMIDFNEVTFEIEEVKPRIAEQVWIRRWAYGHLSSNLKEYYKRRMQEEMTVNQLEAVWNKNGKN